MFYFSKPFKDERFGRISKHRSIVDLRQTLEICLYTLEICLNTLYEDSANFKKMNALQRQNSRPRQTERRGHTNHHVSQRVKVRQNVSKRHCVCRHSKNLAY